MSRATSALASTSDLLQEAWGAPPSTPAQVGFYAPGVEDRPFAGSVGIYGLISEEIAVDYYEFEYATAKSGPYAALPLAAAGGFDRQAFVAPSSWPLVPFPVTQISDGTTIHNVIETIAHYQANNGVQMWDSGTHDLLIELLSLNTLLTELTICAW